MDETQSRAEAERLLTIAEKFLQSRDLSGAKDFAILSQETAPLLDGSDQILAVTDVLLAADTNKINNHPNWYSILQLDINNNPLSSSTTDIDSLKKQYRTLALLLHPDKNKLPFADEAFNLVSRAWMVLSDTAKKAEFDSELGNPHKTNVHVRKKEKQSFWTACPYCYNLYEYPRVYEDCYLKCHNCGKVMHGSEIGTMPRIVEGEEAYYCCWGFFPLGFKTGSGGGGGTGEGDGDEEEGGFGGDWSNRRRGDVTPVYNPNGKKRGRPKKNV